MRRFLFSGIGLALGVFAAPAAGQDGRTAPQPARAASLGRPVAVPDAAGPDDSGVTPVGLRTRWQGAGVPVAGYPAAGVPIAGYPATGIPVANAPMWGAPTTGLPLGVGQPIPAPRPVEGGTPGVTEHRGPSGTVVGGPYVVPTVTPEGMVVSQPCLEDPIYGGCATGMPAVDRLRGCGNKWWTSGEYLMWWSKSSNLPPLVTTSSPQFGGIPGRGDTRVLLGGNFGDTFHPGGRFTVGRWFGDDRVRGVEGRVFFLGQADKTFSASSDQFPLLARPFFNVNSPFGPFSEVIADPARGMGGVVVNRQSSVWGAEANYRRFLVGNPCARIDGIVGYRYFGMKEQLSITESFVSTAQGLPLAGTVSDVFRAENHFHGGQIGLAGEMRRGRWSLDGRATVAFGNVSQIAEIGGSQSLIAANGAVANFTGGLLALPGANIGRYSQNQFAVIPEAGLNLGYQLTSRMRVFFGYNFLYLGNALRPEGLIDTNIDAARIPNFTLPGNPSPLPGLPRPTPQFRLDDYFVQGISFGLSFNW